MSIILPKLPENLDSLQKEEERIRIESLLKINADNDSKSHIELIQDSLNIVYDITHEYENPTDDELTLQFLGIRIFNDTVCSLNRLLSGYYQVAFAIQRDILEILSLFEYFGFDKTQIKRWKICNNEERIKEFKPAKIRKILDKRDGFKDKKREKMYILFCEYALHPSYPGMKLVAPKGLGCVGPFLYEKLLINCLFELAKLSNYSALNYISLFNLPARFAPCQEKFVKVAKEWSDRYRKFFG